MGLSKVEKSGVSTNRWRIFVSKGDVQKYVNAEWSVVYGVRKGDVQGFEEVKLKYCTRLVRKLMSAMR